MRVGIIGAGNVSRFHIEGYRKAGATIVAVADSDIRRAKAVAGSANAEAYSDYSGLLEREDIDAVSICLPNNLHYEASVDALRAGKHVLCEKPMTTTARDARELVKVVEQSGKCFQVAYMKRFVPAFMTGREALGEIGRTLSATVKVFHYLPEEIWTEARERWGMNRKAAGGGALVHAGSHILDILNWWFGQMEVLSAHVEWKPGLDVDWYAAATLMSRRGVTIFFECGWLPLSHIGYFKDGWDERIEVTGDRGRVELISTWWDRCEMSPFVCIYREGESAREVYSEPANGFVAEVQSFVNAVRNSGHVTPNVYDGLAVQELIEAIYASLEREAMAEPAGAEV